MNTTSPLESRILADSRDRPAWLEARRGKIGGSDAARYSKLSSAHLYLKSKLDEQFDGNEYTRHGNDREAKILRQFGLDQNFHLFHSETNPRHVSTPDALRVTSSGEVILAEVKTSSKPLAKIPPNYLRQCQWNMYVLGADRLLFLWEEHQGFQPVRMEPESILVHRDQDMIDQLVQIADAVLSGMDEATQFRRELTQ